MHVSAVTVCVQESKLICFVHVLSQKVHIIVFYTEDKRKREK